MSDDEYYLESPYDEFEEMLWDADPAPNLADDLAQHAAYSPVWQDDPVGELEPYHSDWEYYSDDYYDDDPAILKSAPVDGSEQRKRDNGIPHTNRGRKRKLEEADAPMDSAEKTFLRRTIQGTIWAKSTSPRVKMFTSGQQDTVALLVDWRKRFQTGNTKIRQPAADSLALDESWANDLSLADMGLRRSKEWPQSPKEMDEQEDKHEDEGFEEDAEDGETNHGDGDFLEFGQTSPDIGVATSESTLTSKSCATPAALALSIQTECGVSDNKSNYLGRSEATRRSKRQRTYENKVLLELSGGTVPTDSMMETGIGFDPKLQERSSKASPDHSGDGSTCITEHASEDLNNIRTRKRKASVDTHELRGAIGSTTGSRAENGLSKQSAQGEIEGEPPMAQTRSVRKRKK